MVGTRRGKEPSRIPCDTSQAPSPEHARQRGTIRPRSGSQLGFPGLGVGAIRRPLAADLPVWEAVMDETDKGNGATAKLPYGIRFAHGNEAVRDARLLFKECASSLGFDLRLQDFARELAELPGECVSPAGALLVAFCDGQPSGCVAMRPLGTSMCEMKRLYVRHTYRGKGVGRQLVETVVKIARESGHKAMRLDTLPWMRQAIEAYRSLGFRPIPPYRDNPIAGTQSLELDLSGKQAPVARLRHLFEPQPLRRRIQSPLDLPGSLRERCRIACVELANSRRGTAAFWESRLESAGSKLTKNRSRCSVAKMVRQ